MRCSKKNARWETKDCPHLSARDGTCCSFQSARSMQAGAGRRSSKRPFRNSKRPFFRKGLFSEPNQLELHAQSYASRGRVRLASGPFGYKILFLVLQTPAASCWQRGCADSSQGEVANICCITVHLASSAHGGPTDVSTINRSRNVRGVTLPQNSQMRSQWSPHSWLLQLQ